MKRKLPRKKLNSAATCELLDRRILLADVLGLALNRAQVYTQWDASTVDASTFAPYVFGTTVFESGDGTVTSGTVTSPALPNAPYELSEDSDSNQFSDDVDPYKTQAALDVDFPISGTYKVQVNTVHDGTKNFNLSFAGATYPTTVPKATNYDALQKVDSTKAITIQWPAFAGGTANDFIIVSLINVTDGTDTYTSKLFYEPGFLNGTATQVTIPAGTLDVGQEYGAAIGFAKRAQIDTSTYPGAPAIVFYGKSTSFLLHTIGGTGKISGAVYNDVNSNGVKENGENGIAGVTVYLDTNNNNALDAIETKTTTNASGQYSFTDLYAGSHQVRQVLPAGMRKSQPAAGQPGYNEFLDPAQEVMDDNFGVTKNILLAGKVYNDANSNGVQDTGEFGIVGVVINIKSNGATVATRTTDFSGSWQVKGLGAGTGEAVVVVPAGRTVINPASGKYTGSMTSGQQNANLNFAMHLNPPAPVAAVASSILLMTGNQGSRLLEDLLDLA